MWKPLYHLVYLFLQTCPEPLHTIGFSKQAHKKYPLDTYMTSYAKQATSKRTPICSAILKYENFLNWRQDLGTD